MSMASSYGALESLDEEVAEIIPETSNKWSSSSFHGVLEKGRKLIVMSVTVTSLILIMSIGAFMKVDTHPTASVNTYSKVGHMSSSSDSLGFISVSNNYGIQDLSLMLPYPFLVNSFLIEPYKEATILLEEPYEGCTYDWYFTKRNDDSVSFNGTSDDGSILIIPQTVGEYEFSAQEICADVSSPGRTLDMSVWVKYVRRELSTLTDEDREEFLDAFHILWTVSTTKGKTLYGDRYKSVNYFATLHNDGGGNDVCDEFHGGYGFLNNHMYLSAYLEQSLQLINPKVALHYMEYSKYFASDAFQSHLTNQFDTGSWTDILTSKFFGASDPITGKISDGRWADAIVPHMTLEFMEEEGIDSNHTFFAKDELGWLSKSAPHLSSPYGLLRSPWNYNPSHFITRYGNVYRINDTTIIGPNRDLVFKFHMGVNCTNYQNYVRYIIGKPLQTYLVTMEDDTHGIFHFTLGGVGGDVAATAVKVLMDVYGFTHSNIAALAISAQHFYKKNLAMSQDYPVNCTTNPWQNYKLTNDAKPGSLHGPTCDFADFYYEDEDSLSGLVEYFFNYDTDYLDYVVDRVQVLEFEDKKAVMQIIANMFPFDGDLAGSSAALDPLFWVAHGAMERLFQKAVFADVFSDMNYTSVSHCSGHDATTGKSWLEGFFFTNETIVAEDVTNAELTAILNPSSDQYRDLINFVYDTDSFSWCENSDTWFA